MRAIEIDPPMSPVPASDVRVLTKAPSTPPERPDLFACVERGRSGRDHEALEEAARQFEGDLRAELAAIEAGAHPLQRRDPARR